MPLKIMRGSCENCFIFPREGELAVCGNPRGLASAQLLVFGGESMPLTEKNLVDPIWFLGQILQPHQNVF